MSSLPSPHAFRLLFSLKSRAQAVVQARGWRQAGKTVQASIHHADWLGRFLAFGLFVFLPSILSPVSFQLSLGEAALPAVLGFLSGRDAWPGHHNCASG